MLEKVQALRERYFASPPTETQENLFRQVESIYAEAREFIPEFHRHAPVASHFPVIFLVSYPRSGNTLVHRMLTTLFATREYQAFTGSGPFTFSKLLYDPEEPRVRIVKDHIYRSEYLWDRTIVVVRDGRDACLSLAHFTRQEGLHSLISRNQLPDFLNFTREQYSFGDWVTSVRTTLNALRLGAAVRIARYEDLITRDDVVHDLVRFVDPESSITLSRISEVRREVEMRRKQIDHPAWGYHTSYDSSSYLHQWCRNRMGSNWRTAFDADAARMFHEMGATELLMELGYESDPEWWKKQPC